MTPSEFCKQEALDMDAYAAMAEKWPADYPDGPSNLRAAAARLRIDGPRAVELLRGVLEAPIGMSDLDVAEIKTFLAALES